MHAVIVSSPVSEAIGCGRCKGIGYLPKRGIKCPACRGSGLQPTAKPTAARAPDGERRKDYKLKIADSERATLQQAADIVGVPLAEWIRTAALRASRDVVNED